MNSAQMLALSAVVMSEYAEEMPAYIDTSQKHTGSKGLVCGRDSGVGKKKQPRNSPCKCGSGKKAKKCCVYE